MRSDMKVLFSILLVVVTFTIRTSAFEGPVITLPYITLEGAYSSEYNITHYRRIPFAASTAGQNRFRAPQPPLPIKGTYNTDQSFPSCPLADGSGSEDCLYLGIYSRPWGRGAKLRPVTVVLHGGAYTAGTASFNIPPYGYPTLNVSMSNDFVLVYPNYRLGALGFLPGKAIKDAPDAALNPGLLDQQAALKWVHENIKHFGGDPEDVAIFGQSAGGGSVIAQVIANGGRTTPRLFQRALASSPYWLKTYQYDDPEAEAIHKEFLNLTGCSEAVKLLDCLRNVDLNTTMTASSAVNGEWAPVVDGEFLQDTLSKAVGNKLLNADLVWGMFNTMEGERFVSSDLESPSATPYNSTEAGFDRWLRDFLPRFSVEQLEAVRKLYPASGVTDTSTYNTTYARAGYVYRDTVLACPAYWSASGAREMSWLGEYTVPPALHVSLLENGSPKCPFVLKLPLTWKREVMNRIFA
ncbi:hypothetical protein VMCG_06113 [Cytospora schulzeri]|uniref:Carboxylic ester hydrolase n=1 Tax=Cytospora schulzeri TaxID=448051 RepID=A0A423WGM9_9PEZI|nr:hypothetical protein VMCG_06113 [Valsa malicola]